MLQLVLDTAGIHLEVRNRCFEVRSKTSKRLISPKKIDSILITTNVRISSAAILLAAKLEIGMVFINRTGKAMANLGIARFGGTAKLRLAQYNCYFSLLRFSMARMLLLEKIKNQIITIEKISKWYPSTDVNNTLNQIHHQLNNILNSNSREELKQLDILRGFEGTASKVYWSVIKSVLPSVIGFKGRGQRPAKDIFNAVLNYGYGMMYNMIEEKCMSIGLDPQIGFLHEIQYGKPVLTFDIIEVFRSYWDRHILQLIVNGDKLVDYIDDRGKYIYLNRNGKKKIISTFNKFSHSDFSIHNKQRTFKSHLFAYILDLQHQLINHEK